MLENLQIVLVETRFPENIGAIARASANFGNIPICLVQPERWDYEKAVPMATSQGEKLLAKIEVYESLEKALASSVLCLATTARLGGLRQEIFTPRQIAPRIISSLENSEKVSIVFGPEDRGLENIHLDYCQHIINIPTTKSSSSLNLAQAVMLVLYECFLLLPEEKKTVRKNVQSRRIYNEERQLLHTKLKKCLVELNVINGDNPDYFFKSMAKLLDRADLRRHEMDLLLGICRQIENLPKFHDGNYNV